MSYPMWNQPKSLYRVKEIEKIDIDQIFDELDSSGTSFVERIEEQEPYEYTPGTKLMDGTAEGIMKQEDENWIDIYREYMSKKNVGPFVDYLRENYFSPLKKP